jgi:hypothetical protein
VAQGEHVQQALGGVGAAAVAGVDDVNVGRHVAGDEVAGAGGGVAHDKHVRLHGREVGHRVQQGLALALRRGVDVQVDHIRRQPLGGDLEGGAGAGGVLEEDVEDGLAPQQGHLLHVPLGFRHRDEGGGGVQDLGQYPGRQAFQGEEVAQAAVIGELQLGAHGFLMFSAS